MTDDEAWAVEERFWMGGGTHYREALDSQCIMAFPSPAGIIADQEIIHTIEHAPRWSAVDMVNRHTRRPANDIVVLAYEATGQRDGAAPYNAFCTSVYHRAGNRWKLVQHQQTPS